MAGMFFIVFDEIVISNDEAVNWRFRSIWDRWMTAKKRKQYWKAKWKDSVLYPSCQEAVEIDVEAIDFEWKIFHFDDYLFFKTSKKFWQVKNIHPEEFQDRIIFISMFNDIDWSRSNVENCIWNAEKVKICAMKFSQGHCTFVGLRSEEKWFGRFFFFSKKENVILQQRNGTAVQRKGIT